MFVMLSNYKYTFIIHNHQDVMRYNIRNKNDKSFLFSLAKDYRNVLIKDLKKIKKSNKYKNKHLSTQFFKIDKLLHIRIHGLNCSNKRRR